MVYEANADGSISYLGNELCDPIDSIAAGECDFSDVPDRVSNFDEQDRWSHITEINDGIHSATVDYFESLGAKFALLPITTRLSSPPNSDGDDVYAVDWFGQETYLSVSQQMYLESFLIQKDVDQAYSITNASRREKADETHLSEFHHIEYEGAVDHEECDQVALNLIKHILDHLLDHHRSNLDYFLAESEIERLEEIHRADPKFITLREAMDVLLEETGDEKYEELSMEHFGDWEEVFVSEYFGDRLVCVRDYPLAETGFTGQPNPDSEYDVAKISNVLWPGYREVVDVEERLNDPSAVRSKAEYLDVPESVYEPYLSLRESDTYQRTSGFGFGWDRLLQAILQMPTIFSASHYPRVHAHTRP